jgi:hypothetical protein
MEKLDEQWKSSPGLPALLQAAEEASGMPFEAQVEWSERLRAVGLWSSCPLIATAQNGALPVAQRAIAAGAAWAAYGDRQGRAVLRSLWPALSPSDMVALCSVVPAESIEDLRNGPVIWSVTPFFNEFAILEARLSEMARSVDHFVVIEAPVTQRGVPKPLYFQENQERFSRWSAQIDHRVVQLPEGPDNWRRERRQRDVGREVLADLGAGDSDLVLSTDLDEIVRADKVGEILKATEQGPVILMMDMYWYSPDWRDPVPWLHPKAFRFGQVPAETPYSDIRHQPYPVLPNAGWHLSWFGDKQRIETKMKAVADDVDTDQNRSEQHQDRMLTEGIAIHGRKLQHSSDYFPASLSRVFGGAAQ